MEIRDIPFVKQLGIRQDKGTLTLSKDDTVVNHLQTIHAGAQYTLAETQSGHYLLSLFPEYKECVIPLLRASSVKYKHPATTDIYAIATVEDAVKIRFIEQFTKKDRASIIVKVEVRDTHDVLTMQGDFEWFIQKRDIS